jgi:sterol desaturase/sphingolipid hydroxylase (fatty acid hydroxylase superfamily)
MSHLLDVMVDKISGPNAIGIALLWITVIASVVISYFHSGLPVSWRAFRNHMIPPGTLSHPSARADMLFWITRKFINLVFFAPAVLGAVGIGTLINLGLSALFGAHPATSGPISTWMLMLFTLMMFLAYDFSYYLYHNAQHRVPILWEIHKVHHSAEVMVGVTKDRIHPIDDFMNHIWDGCVTGVVYGIWLFFAYDPVELTIFGVNVYVLRNILMMDFTRHTHYKISFGKYLNQVILCPHYHQLHHSVAEEHWDKNFGLMLPIWDRMFGTLKVPKPDEDFVFGLTNEEHREYRSWLKLYYLPFVKIYAMTLGRIVLRERSHDHV